MTPENAYMILPVEIIGPSNSVTQGLNSSHSLKVRAMRSRNPALDPKFNGNAEFVVDGDFSYMFGKNATKEKVNEIINSIKNSSSEKRPETQIMISGRWDRNCEGKFLALGYINFESYINSIKIDNKSNSNAVVEGKFLREFLSTDYFNMSKLYKFEDLRFKAFDFKEINSLFSQMQDKNKSNLINELQTNPKGFLANNGITRERLHLLNLLVNREHFCKAVNYYTTMRLMGANSAVSMGMINKHGHSCINELRNQTFNINELSYMEKSNISKSINNSGDNNSDYYLVKEAISSIGYTGSTAFPIITKWKDEGEDLKRFESSILYKIMKLKYGSDVPKLKNLNSADRILVNSMLKDTFSLMGNVLGSHGNSLKKIYYARENNGSRLKEVTSMAECKETHVFDSGYISDMTNFQIEKSIVSNLKRIMNNGYMPMSNNAELIFDIDPYAAQKNAVKQSLDYSLSIITGGPGVGKTTVLESVLKTLEAGSNKKLNIKLVAPTGKASSRMSESTGRDADTIHTAMKFVRNQGFKISKENPLDADVLVIDESSMVDIEVFNDLLSGIKEGTKVIIVGDKDQLPSVGPGAVLQELISSKVIPFTILNEAKRQKNGSFIVKNAYDIIAHKKPSLNRLDSGKNDFVFIDAKNDNEISNIIEDLVSNQLTGTNGQGYGMSDIQLLTPRNKRKDGVTCLTLNEQLRDIMNPDKGKSFGWKDRSFRLGDRIMCNKNDPDNDLSNGQQGVITNIDYNNKTAKVEFEHLDEGDHIELDQSYITERGRFDLSYCTTIHKSQGSEYPVVIIPISEHYGDQFMMNAKLIYTAITRARKKVYLVGSEKALEKAIKKTIEIERTSCLSKMLQAEFDRLPDNLVNDNVKIILENIDDAKPSKERVKEEPKNNPKKNVFLDIDDVPFK